MKLAVKEYLQSAQSKIEQEQWQEAKLDFQKALELEPRRWDICFNLGVVLLKQRQHAQAVTIFRQAIAIKPDYDWSYHNLGKAFLQLHQIDDAIQSFIQAVTLNQNNPQFYYDLGDALIQKSSFEQALSCFRKAMALFPKDHELWFRLGTAWRNQGLNSEATNCFCQTIQLNPDYNSAYTSLKYVELDAQQSKSLISLYRQVLAQNPRHANALANLAELLAKQDNLQESIALSRQAIKTKTIQANPQLANANWQVKKQAPDFMIIGAGKSGTTSLYRYLEQHPQILLPNKKELRFFDQNFGYGYEWYLAQFPAVCDRPDFLTGEASPSYLFLPQVAQRIKDLAPQTKLIVILRNPVERSISDYYQNKKSGRQQLNLEDMIAKEINNINQKPESELTYGGGSLARSLYFYKLQRWFKIFPREQFLILDSQKFFATPNTSMERVFQFLNLDTVHNGNYPKYNVGSYPEVSNDIKDQLASFFAPPNQKLEELLEMKFDW